VNPTLFSSLAITDVLATLVALRYGFIAATEGEGPRKGKAILISLLAYSAFLSLLGLEPILRNGNLTIHEFEGKIESAQIHRTDHEHYTTYLQIRNAVGSDIAIHTSAPSPFFRTGEQLKGHYRGDYGELVNAYFFAADGRQEGDLGRPISNVEFVSNLVAILLGFLCACFGLINYRRDPEGTGKWLRKRV
jgi:hypothetical protein